MLKCPAKLLFFSESEVCLEVNHNHGRVGAIYDIRDWNFYDLIFSDTVTIPRTNNLVEGFHRGFAERFTARSRASPGITHQWWNSSKGFSNSSGSRTTSWTESTTTSACVRRGRINGWTKTIYRPWSGASIINQSRTTWWKWLASSGIQSEFEIMLF